MTFVPAWLHVTHTRTLSYVCIQSHKTVLKEFESNFPYLLWIFMWYRIICLSQLMFIIVVVFCWFYALCRLNFCSLLHYVCKYEWMYTILLDTFSFIQSTGKEKEQRQQHTHSHNKWNKRKKNGTATASYCKCVQFIHLFFFLLFSGVTCDNSNKLKTFVMFVDVWVLEPHSVWMSLKCHNEIHFHSKKSHVSVRNCAS